MPFSCKIRKGAFTQFSIYKVYLNITNPMDMDATGDPDQWVAAFPEADLPESGSNEEFYRAVEEYFEDEWVSKWEAAESIQAAIESNMGYDGITHIGGGRFDKRDETRHRVFIAFQPEQIKRTDNRNPTDDPDIRYSLPKTGSSYTEPTYQEWDVQAALYDAMDHADESNDNLIRVGNMPKYITEKLGIEGDFYIYRNHAYENMVSREQAIKDGRPVTRKGVKIHFHDFGVDTMTEAIMSLENPTMTIATKTAEGNPAVIMLLPVKGKNKAPLYAVLSFYSNRKINGDYSRRPHIVLTIAERDFFGSNGRGGYAEIIGNAVKDGRVIDYNKKMRDDLSVIANPAGVGNITDSSLSDNLARFRKEIKSFREKYKIDYKLPVGEDTSPRALLANAFEGVAQNELELKKIQEYRDKVGRIDAEEKKLLELRKQIWEMSFAKGERDSGKLRQLQEEAEKTANRINTYDRQLLRLEASKPLQSVLDREKKKAYERGVKKNKEALEDYRKKAEQQQKEIIDRYQEFRKKGLENRQKTAIS